MGSTTTTASAPARTMFRARGTHFKAVLKPSRRKLGEFGSEFTAGEYADFQPNGTFETDDPGVLERLRGLPTYGVEFFEVGNEPGALPSSEPVVMAIMEAATELDDARLAQIEAEEQGGYARPEVLSQVRLARASVQRLIDERGGLPEGSGSADGGGG